ncbi:MAG: SusD/RagB family nutrient-binding outer membrane lipoprotein, partial [Bacteroidetes bacterium]|nr:SusD/RagB family nutrient-binding outer membrane lipoprotein [Bacteroidota bacterium]
AAETHLLRAEAADRGWTTENMGALYQAGVEISFQQWGLAAPAGSYFAQPNVALTSPAGTGANIRNIAIQQYVAAYPDGLRGWSIWRRTGFPTLTPAQDATNSSRQIPRRYTYGQTSYASNTAAVTAAAAAIGGDTQDTKIWWDQ